MRRIDHQQRALARGQAARHFVGKVNVAGSIDQIQLILLTVECGIAHAHSLGLDRNTLLAFQLHLIERLLHQFAPGDRPCKFQQAISQR